MWTGVRIYNRNSQSSANMDSLATCLRKERAFKKKKERDGRKKRLAEEERRGREGEKSRDRLRGLRGQSGEA